jgi:hypothetical protein
MGPLGRGVWVGVGDPPIGHLPHLPGQQGGRLGGQVAIDQPPQMTGQAAEYSGCGQLRPTGAVNESADSNVAP